VWCCYCPRVTGQVKDEHIPEWPAGHAAIDRWTWGDELYHEPWGGWALGVGGRTKLELVRSVDLTFHLIFDFYSLSGSPWGRKGSFPSAIYSWKQKFHHDQVVVVAGCDLCHGDVGSRYPRRHSSPTKTTTQISQVSQINEYNRSDMALLYWLAFGLSETGV